MVLVRVGREKTGEAWTGSGGRAEVVLSPKARSVGRAMSRLFSLARLEMIEETREGSNSVLQKGKEG